MIITCYDCPDPVFPDSAKEWRIPCQECADQFVAYHEGDTGHHVKTRAETRSDRYVFARL